MKMNISLRRFFHLNFGETFSHVFLAMALAAGSVAPGFSQTLTHRYEFNEPAGSTTFTDAVGTVNGTVYGNAGLDGNGNLVLPGGSSPDNNNYGDLGPNLITGYPAVTFECWVTFGSNPTWGRLVDFGDTDAGSGLGSYCIDFTPHSGNSPNGINFEVSDADPGFNHAQAVAVPPILDNGGEIQLVLVYDPPSQSLLVYTNGQLMGQNTNVTIPLSAIVNAHSYLGKSSYAGDPNGVAVLDEFRIYNGVLSPLQIAVDNEYGPSTITNAGPLAAIHLAVPSQVYISQKFPATVTGDYQNIQGVNLSFVNPTVQSGNTNVLTVGQNQVLTAVNPGTTTVVASYGGFSATQTVSVTELPAVLTHRYDFNEPAGSTTFTDLVGNANGTVNGSASLDGNGNLILPGGASPDNNNYGDLGPNLITGYAAVTFECWVTFGSNPTWGRLVDFGETDGNGNGAYCIDFTPHSGNTPNGINFEVSDADPGFNHAQAAAVPPILDNGSEIYLALIYDPLSQSLSVYTNGLLMAQNTNVTIPMSAIVNAHSYLGKSSYAGDPNGVATLDEFRVYNGVLSPVQIALDAIAGPTNIISNPGLLTNINLMVNTTLTVSVPTTATVTGDYTGIQGVNLAFAGANVVLTSGNTNVLQIEANGTINPLTPGTTTLTATYQGQQAHQTITVTTIAPVLAHRYSFAGPAGNTTITDSVGGQDGAFSGSSGGLDGNGNLVLNGVDGYVDLGPNLISAYTNMTVETWVTVSSNDANNARLFDFGDTDSGGEGAYGLDFSPHAGATSWFEVFNADPGYPTAQQVLGPSLAGAGQVHLVVVYDPQLPYAAFYTNGVLAASGSINIPFSALVDNHDYLGRSGYNGDPYLTASLKEFRLYTGDMSAAEVAADYAAGPGTLSGAAPSLSITYSAGAITLSWPATATGYTVQTTAALGTGAAWGALPGSPTPILANGVYQVTLPVSGQTAFYRLTH